MNQTRNRSRADSPERFWPQAARWALIAAAYWVSVRVGLLFVAQPEGIASVWPASGLALAMLLLQPKNQWSRILAVLFIINAAGNWSSGNTLAVSLGFALANILEPLLSAWGITYFCRSKISFTKIREVITLFAAVICVNGFTALLGAAIPAMAFGAPFIKTWQLWWAADGLGMILLTPFIVTIFNRPSENQPASPRMIPEGILLVSLMLSFGWLLFGPFTDASNPLLRNYMVFPFLIWLGFRFRVPSMAGTLILFASLAIGFTLQDKGIFAIEKQTLTQHLISLQLFLFILTFSGLFLSALITERFHGKFALNESDKKYRGLFDNAILAIFQSTIDGRVILVNPTFSKMFGYDSPEEVMTKINNVSTDIFADPERRLEIIRLRAENPELSTFENLYRRKDGSTFPGRLSIRTVKDASGGSIGFEGFIEDISERKQAETRLRLFWDLPLIGMAITSPDSRFLNVNQKLADMFGYSRQELAGRNWVELTHPDDVILNTQLLGDIVAGKRDQYTLDKRFIQRDGQVLYAHIAAHCVRRTDGTVDYLVLVIQDITESKLAEDNLKKTKDLLSSTERIGNVGGWEINNETRVLTWTEEIYRIHEVDLSFQPTLEDGLNFYAPHSRPIIEEAMQRAVKNGQPFNVELEIITAKGNQRWVHAIGEADLEHRRVFGFFQDITQRKQMDEKLRISEVNFRNLAESTTDGILIGTATGEHIYANSHAALILGYTADEILQTSQIDLVDPSVYPQLKQRLEGRLAGRAVPSRYETLLRRKDGSIFHAEVAGTRTVWQGQACDLVFLRDITERKQAEQALQDFAYFPALSPGPTLSVDTAGIIKQANPAAYSLGLVSGTSLSSGILEMSSFNFTDCIQNEAIDTIETRLNDRVFLMTIHGVSGLKQAYVYGSDITERKQTEIILQSRMKISQFADSHTLDELLQLTLDEAEALTGSNIGFGHFLEADQKTLKLQMWSTNTLKNMCTAEGKDSHYPVEQAGVWVDAVRTRAAVIHNDYPNLAHRKGLPKGHAPVTRELVVPILRNDLIMMIMGVGNKPTDYTDHDIFAVSQLADFCWDIIQRKRIETLVRENEERYRTVVSNAPGIIFMTDDKGIFTLSEGKGLDRLGLQPGQAVGQSVMDMYKDYPEIIDKMKKALGGSHQRHESKVQGIVFDIMYSPILDQHGRVKKVLGVATDITERKQMEIALKESEVRLRFITANIPDYIVMQDKDLKYTFVLNPQLGLTEQEMIGKTDHELLSREEADRLTQAKREVIASGNSMHFETSLMSRSGKTEFFDGTFVPKYDSANQNDGLIGYFKNVTERKSAEEALRLSELFNKSVLNSLTAHIGVLDEKGVIIAVNEAWKNFARENGSADPEAYLGNNYFAACEAAIRSGDQTADQVDLGIHAVLDGQRSHFKAEYPCNSPTQQRWFSITVVPLQEPTRGVIIIHQDITDSKQAQQALEASQVVLKAALDMEKSLARTDSLTGVHNRRHLYEIAEHEFEISRRYQQPLAILMFDIDHFKKFNDTFGHLVGDQILKMVTDAAGRELRSADAIGRYGGEEFIILLPMTTTEHAYSLAERIRTAVAGLVVPTEKGDAHVTLSIGIVEKQFSLRTESVEEVFQRADKAMYAAKQAGRNHTVIGQ